MNTKIFAFIFFVLTILSCGKNDKDVEEAKTVIDNFYEFYNIEDYKSISQSMAIEFYRNTPNTTFIKLLKSKHESFGNFKRKELESYDVTLSSNSNTEVLLSYKVNFELKQVHEIFLLEKRNDRFQIVEYRIK